jgi:hypothetical protein
MGKLLEQVNLELNEEDEIKRIREAKTNFTKRLVDEKQRVLKVEDEEIKKKRDNDNIKKLKKAEKANRANAQRKVISRLFAKTYFKNIKVNSLTFLGERGLFNNYIIESTKDKLRGIIHTEAENLEIEESELDKLLDNVDDQLLKNETVEHKSTLAKHNKEMEEEKQRMEIKRGLEEEEAKKKWEGKLERARKKKLLRLQEEIQKAIFDQPLVKGEVIGEDISEIDNLQQDGPYSTKLLIFSRSLRRIASRIHYFNYFIEGEFLQAGQLLYFGLCKF